MLRKTEVKLNDLFDLVRADYRQNGYKEEVLTVNLRHLNGLGDRSAVRIETRDIEFYKADREREGAAKSSIQLELNTLKRAFTLGLDKEYIKFAPKVPRYSKKILDKNIRKGFFEHDQYEKQLAACLPYQRQCLRFAYFCGWREGELFSLRWDENYVENPPHIRIYNSKNGEGRVLPLLDEHDRPTDLYQVIQEQLVNRVEGCPWIFHYYGGQLNRATFNKHWRQACKQSGVTRYFHDLRRTANRNMKNNGVDQQDRMAIIGHKTPSMDLRYGITNEHDIKVAMGRVFRGYGRLSKSRTRNNMLSNTPKQTSEGRNEQSANKSTYWPCSQCGFFNSRARKECKRCKLNAPVDVQVMPAPRMPQEKRGEDVDLSKQLPSSVKTDDVLGAVVK